MQKINSLKNLIMADYFKYPSIPYFKGESDIVEGRMYKKIDGSNCQVRVCNNRLVPGTRSKGVEDYQKPADWMIAFQKRILTNYSFYNLGGEFILFLEYLSNHNIKYDPSEFDSFEIFIDLFDIEHNKFVDYEDAKDLLETKGIEGIHTLDPIDDKDTHSYGEIIELAKKYFHKEPQFEGFVIKNYENQEFSKFVIEQIDSIMGTFITPEILSEAIEVMKQQKIKQKERLVDIVVSMVMKRTSRHLHGEIAADYLAKMRLIKNARLL